MKKLICIALLVGLWACNTTTEGSQQEELSSSSQGSAMTAFISKFENVEAGKSYDYDWLFNFSEIKIGREVSKQECEQFIAGKSVINHAFGGTASKVLSCDKTYYRVANIPSRPDMITLIISDGEMESYLCTFDASGKFISGIVLQYYIANGESETFRNGGLVDGGTKIILKDAKPGTRLPPMVVYEIANDGTIQLAQ